MDKEILRTLGKPKSLSGKPWHIDIYDPMNETTKQDREWGAWQSHLGEEFRSILVRHNPTLEHMLETKVGLKALWWLANSGLDHARVKWVHGADVSERGDGRVWLDLDRIAAGVAHMNLEYFLVEEDHE